MDYARIYNEFIASRRQKTLGADEPKESHHIVPRHLGGNDDPSNLIDLSPADHFFAHLLLAKMYGGRLWVPVVLWCGGDKGNWRARKSRRNYAWAAQASARHMGGTTAWQYDHTRHVLVHADGRTITATQADIPELVAGTKSGVNLLLKGRIKSYLGWRLPSTEAAIVGRRGGNRHPMADTRQHTFVHASGVTFTGTRYEFCKAYGVPRPNVCELVKGRRVITRGWTLEGAVLPRVGRAHAKSQRHPLTNEPPEEKGKRVADAG